MFKAGRQHKDRVWLVEGCNDIGQHIAQRRDDRGKFNRRPSL
jgi:hypothetical protein